MNVQQLIEVLQKVEDKTMEVSFTYDSRCGGHTVRCVDIEQYLENEEKYPPSVVLRGEDNWEYNHYNHTLSVEEYTKRENAERNNIPDWVGCGRTDWSDEDRQAYWNKHVDESIEDYAKSKKRFDESYKITTLYLEAE